MKRNRKGPKRTEKDVITYCLPKKKKNVAEGGKTTGQLAGHKAFGWEVFDVVWLPAFRTTKVSFSIFQSFSVRITRQANRQTDWHRARNLWIGATATLLLITWLLNAYLPTYTITCLPTAFSPTHLITITAYLTTYRLYLTPPTYLPLIHSVTLPPAYPPFCPPTPPLPLTYLPTHPCTYLTPWLSPWRNDTTEVAKYCYSFHSCLLVVFFAPSAT